MKTLSARLATSKAIIPLQRIIAFFVFTFLSGTLLAQTISIQGVLRDPNGRSVDDGAYSVTFKIYDQETGGTEIWTDTYTSLQTKHGVFQANLGEQTSLDGLGFDTPYYVGVTVEAFDEMAPRIALTVYPYAKAILGQDNKFPSTGNIVLAKDSIIVEQGALKFEGADGRIVFNDGTSLNTADFSGPASALLNPSSININADKDAVGSGAINFQIAGATRASIANDGNASFSGLVTAGFGLDVGSSNTTKGIINIFGNDNSSIYGGQLGLHTSDGQSVDKWFMETEGDNLNLAYQTGGSFPRVATFSSSAADFDVDLYVGKNDETRGWINLYGSGTGSNGGGRVNFHKAADHDGDGTGTATEYWFIEAINDDLRIGNIFSQDDVMTINQLNNVGIGPGAWDPQISLAVGDHDTGIDWVSDGAFNLMQNGNQALSVGGNGKIGIGDNTPDEAQLVVRGNAVFDHFTVQHLDANPVFTQEFVATNWGIFSEHRIMAAAGISTASDERIKKIVAKSNSSSDLEVLNKLKITDYTHIDVVNNGKQLEKKLIAQEVDKAYPIAVNKSTGFIPNIYKQASKSSFVNGKLTIIMDDIHDLKVGGRVKIYSEQGEIIEEVLAVTEKGFTIKTDSSIEKVFVYGIEVDDFHTVDYDAIAMLNVSATQELAKQVEALQKENEALKKKLEKIDLLEAKLNALLDPKDASSDIQIGQE